MTPLWMGFNCLRATKPLQGGRLLMSQGFPNSGKVWGKSEILLGGGYWVVGTWEGVILMMMKMMMNCFCGMVDWQKAFSLISIRDHCQRSSPSRISDMPRTGFEPVQNQASGLVEWSCAVAITTTPWRLTIQSF